MRPKDFNGKTFAINGLKNIGQIGAQAWIDNNGGDLRSLKYSGYVGPARQPQIYPELKKMARDGLLSLKS
jgi:hypothetical protein